MTWKEFRNKILDTIDTESYYRSVLKGLEINGQEAKASCPYKELHANKEDKNPSFTVNLEKGIYVCQTCGQKGNVFTLYKHLNKRSSKEAWIDLGKELNIELPKDVKATPEIDEGLVYKWHKALIENEELPWRKFLKEKRGFTVDTIKRFQLGYDISTDRLTIPIYDKFGCVKNIRMYSWKEDKYKVINYIDEDGNKFGEVRLFNLDAFEHHSILYCEGETDAILASQVGFSAVAPTSGAGSFRNEWLKNFINKNVYIAQDNDDAGRRASEKLALLIGKVAKTVHVIMWPEDFKEKGDITDWFVEYKYSIKDFKGLFKEQGSESKIEDEEAIDVPMHLSTNPKYLNKKLTMSALVTGKAFTPFLCPKTIKYTCAGSCKMCDFCGLAGVGQQYEYTIDAANTHILKLIGCSYKQQESVFKEILCIPQKCGSAKIEVLSNLSIEEIRIIPNADTTTTTEFTQKNAYYVGRIVPNKKYQLYGYLQKHPSNQEATLIFYDNVPEKDITELVMSDDELSKLKIFQPSENQTVRDKIYEIHEDLEYNVTNIWQRTNVAIATDIIYNTVQSFYFQKQFVHKGWGELLILGDSGQAKTTLVEKLMEHYRVGEMLSGEAARRTGLLYNIQQMKNNSWFLVWGALPLNNGGLLAIDELSGVSEEDLSLMSSARSSGIVKVTGVITSETAARTRLIFISNPRNGKQLNTEIYPATAVLKLFDKTEDVRRLDMVVAVMSGEIDNRLINVDVSTLPTIEHKYTSDLCLLRTSWAWSRKPSDIIIDSEVTKVILEYANDLGSTYSSKVPLVEAADIRLKLARLSIGVATILFSTDDLKHVIVKKEHVDFVVELLHELYKGLKYDTLSSNEVRVTKLDTEDCINLNKEFSNLPLRNHNSVIKKLVAAEYISRVDLRDFLDDDELKALFNFLFDNDIIEKALRSYRYTTKGRDYVNNYIKVVDTEEEEY